MDLFLVFFSAAIVNNFVLTYFLGICPFIGVSNKISSAFSMGLATTFVMTITSIVTWLIYHLILVEFNLEFLQYVSFILVIASLVQFVEMFVKKISQPLYRALGIFLPLAITIMAGIREELDVADVPKPFQGAPITLIIAGILALAFMGFSGMIS